ncbi:Vacuolar protein sorting-associated protein atg6, variant 2 [Entomophthora muscae]|uniref:Vacuolar protein sorting-associated protein atg6, variant 2 n=1 Tax=Entomophthora muscae TaxID=34485 RepID=A0ACC2UMX8_9FUNG|nr:Vacuolar protein sorting-associated protein atg6, variant 2 [Entomophthora muscae]
MLTLRRILPQDGIDHKLEHNENHQTRKPHLSNSPLLKHMDLQNSQLGVKQPKLVPPQNYSNLSVPTPNQPKLKSPSQDNAFPGEGTPTDSFVMLASQLAASTLNPYAVNNEEEPGLPTIPSNYDFNGMRDFNLNQSKNVHNWLFNQLSASTNLEHPLCESCTEVLAKIMSRKLADATREKARYIEFGNQRRVQQTKTLSAYNADIEKLKSEESAAITTLHQLESQLEKLKLEISSLEVESQALDAQELSYWKELNSYHLQLFQFHNERDSIEAKYNHDQKLLHVLHTTSIYNDMFNISSRHSIGTINGLRLGKLPPEHNVEWNEINAAWGQTLLALYTIAIKLKFEFIEYRLVPQGSYSTVERLLPGGAIESYELFLPQESFSRIWLVRHYNSAMTGFLACLDQLAAYVKSLDPNFRLNYRISKENIGNYSIHLQYNSYPLWTKALRCTLSNIKSLLSFVTKNSVSLASTP